MNIRAASPTEIRKAIEKAQPTRFSDQAFRDEAALRAMQAMIGLITAKTSKKSMNDIPKAAFDWADDMLDERKKRT